MTIGDLRLACFNAISLGISFTAVENSLKIILLLASIVYTVQKIYETHKRKNETNKEL
jgi:hypothetical protein